MLSFGLKPASTVPAGYGLNMGKIVYSPSIDDGDPRRGMFATSASPRAKPTGLGTTVLSSAQPAATPKRPKLSFGLPSFESLSPFARADTAPTLTYGSDIKPAATSFGGLAGLMQGLSMGVPVGQNVANSSSNDGSDFFGSVIQTIPQGSTASMDTSVNAISAASDLARSIMGNMLTKASAPSASPAGGASAAFGGGISGGSASLMTPMNIGIAAAVVVGVVYLASSGGKRKRKR